MQTKKTFLFNPEPGASHGILGGEAFTGLISDADPIRSKTMKQQTNAHELFDSFLKVIVKTYYLIAKYYHNKI